MSLLLLQWHQGTPGTCRILWHHWYQSNHHRQCPKFHGCWPLCALPMCGFLHVNGPHTLWISFRMLVSYWNHNSSVVHSKLCRRDLVLMRVRNLSFWDPAGIWIQNLMNTAITTKLLGRRVEDELHKRSQLVCSCFSLSHSKWLWAKIVWTVFKRSWVQIPAGS